MLERELKILDKICHPHTRTSLKALKYRLSEGIQTWFTISIYFRVEENKATMRFWFLGGVRNQEQKLTSLVSTGHKEQIDAGFQCKVSLDVRLCLGKES